MVMTTAKLLITLIWFAFLYMRYLYVYKHRKRADRKEIFFDHQIIVDLLNVIFPLLMVDGILFSIKSLIRSPIVEVE